MKRMRRKKERTRHCLMKREVEMWRILMKPIEMIRTKKKRVLCKANKEAWVTGCMILGEELMLLVFMFADLTAERKKGGGAGV